MDIIPLTEKALREANKRAEIDAVEWCEEELDILNTEYFDRVRREENYNDDYE